MIIKRKMRNDRKFFGIPYPRFRLAFHPQCCIIATGQDDRWRSTAYTESENIGADGEYRREYQIRCGTKKTAVDDSTTAEMEKGSPAKKRSPQRS